MDIDDAHEEQPELITLFDLEPDSFPWRPPVFHEIEDRRVKMADSLIFDVLLSSGGVQYPRSLYPPIDIDGLQRLLDAIENSTYDALKQDCLIYFLLKWHRDEREFDFKEERCIPPQFVALADAYWHLDTGIEISKAISLLSDARLNRDYTTKILQALSLANDPNTLIRKYIRTAKPLLIEPNDIDAFVTALAEASLLEAWLYQRTFTETSETRERAFRTILDWCLTPKPRVTSLKHLLGFPLSPYEERILHSYAIDPPLQIPVSSIPALHDTVCLRLVQAGQFASAIKLERQLSARNMSRTNDRYQKAAQERRQMMDEIMAAMPVPERQLLEIELEQLGQGKGAGVPSLSASWSSRIGNSADLTMSWESVRAPPAINGAPASASASATATRAPAPFIDSPSSAIPQRSGAPRFGGPLPTVSPHTAQQDVFTPLSFSTSTSYTPALAASTSTASPLFGSALPALQPAGNTSLAGSSAFRFSPANRVAQSIASANTSANGVRSLFDVAGSANQMPNAFYQPPPSAGVKRRFGQDAGRTALSAFHSPQPQELLDDPSIDRVEEMIDDDPMRTDDEPMQNGHTEPSPIEEAPHENSVSGEFSVSVFAPQSDSYYNNSRTPRAEGETQTLPGAFGPESDEESEPFAPPPSRRTRRVPPQPTPSPPPPPRRATRTRKPVKERDLGRSLPGTLIDEEEEIDEDVVAPLPPPTPATRKAARRTRTSRQDEMTEAELTRPRRSTRLSTASSRGSSSPEPPSPQKPPARSRSTRKSAAGTTTTSKGTSRKKRS